MRNYILLIGLLACSHASSQNEFNIWYFGSYAGLDFNSGSPVPINNSKMVTLEGCASVCNSSGQLLFYTNGVFVWNRFHNLMPNGSGLDGHQTTAQSATVVKKPGNNSLYYVFTLDYQANNRGFRYSILDMNLDAGKGDITAYKNIPIAGPTCEKLTVVRHSNGIDFWIIVQLYNSNTFHSYLLSTKGLSVQPVVSSIGTVISLGGLFAMGQLHSSLDGKKISIANDFRGIEVFDFDNSNGKLSNVRTFDFDPPFYPSFWDAYSIQFSPNGRFLYATGNTGSSQYFLMQMDLSIDSDSTLMRKVVILDSTAGAKGAIQIGPDRKLYFVWGFSDHIGVINKPDLAGTACDVELEGVYLNGASTSLGLPAYSFPLKEKRFFDYKATCAGDTSYFFPTVSKGDSLVWKFGDGKSYITKPFENQVVRHIYKKTGTFIVLLHCYSNGSLLETLRDTLVIGTKPRVYLGNDTTYCGPFMHLLDAGPHLKSYTWSTQDSIRSITVDSQGQFWVLVEDSVSCLATDTIILDQLPLPHPVISYDSFACQKKYYSVRPQSGYSIRWNTGQTDAGITVSQTGGYKVEFYNEFCSETDSVFVMIPPRLSLDLGTDTSICKGTLVFRAPKADSYVWSTGSLDSVLSVEANLQNKPQTLWLEVSEQGCVYRDSLQILPCPIQIYPVNAFSPDMDGLNDRFRILGLDNSSAFSMQIYNRWGELIYKTMDHNMGWDGSYQDSDAPQGVYIYLISFIDHQGTMHSLSGTVTLLR